MILHLLRHAKTEPIYPGISDKQRRLLSKGKKQCDVLHSYILEMNLTNTLCYSSEAIRTIETATCIFRDSLQFSIKKQLYLATSKSMLSFINDLQTEKDIFIVGHNDGISDLVCYLTLNLNITLRTAEYVQIQFDVDNSKFISNGLGFVVKSFRPELG